MGLFWRESIGDIATCFRIGNLRFGYVWMITICLFLGGSDGGGISNEILTSPRLKLSPKFVEDIENITVTAGRESILSCVVENLGDYKVGWLKVDTQTILSLQKRVVTHNSRISVTHDEHRTWNLRIKQVKESDRGCYMCQINTPIMKSSIGCIEVYVPPNILDNATSSDTTVKEGDSIMLTCQADGYPAPRITWRREDRKAIRMTSSGREYLNMEELRGQNITLVDITRKDMGAYLCMASNGVPPIVSKRIQLNVNFPPSAKVNNQLIGAPLGTKVELRCEVEAHPAAVNYWEKVWGEKQEMLLKGKKYNITERTKGYISVTKLEIKSFSKDDEGAYNCLTTNSLGKKSVTIKVYMINAPSPTTTTERHQRNRVPTSSSVNLRKKQEKNEKDRTPTRDRDSDEDETRQNETPRLNIDSNDIFQGGHSMDSGFWDSDLNAAGKLRLMSIGLFVIVILSNLYV